MTVNTHIFFLGLMFNSLYLMGALPRPSTVLALQLEIHVFPSLYLMGALPRPSTVLALQLENHVFPSLYLMGALPRPSTVLALQLEIHVLHKILHSSWRSMYYIKYCIAVWIPAICKIEMFSAYSTHFQIGGDHSKVEGGILQNQYAKQSRILLPLWHFHFWKQNSRKKMHLDRQFVACPAAVECPEFYVNCQQFFKTIPYNLVLWIIFTTIKHKTIFLLLNILCKFLLDVHS